MKLARTSVQAPASIHAKRIQLRATGHRVYSGKSPGLKSGVDNRRSQGHDWNKCEEDLPFPVRMGSARELYPPRKKVQIFLLKLCVLCVFTCTNQTFEFQTTVKSHLKL